MLRSLSIRDIVLIERLELEVRPGLSVLTGETGAGKSIILDALGLALGGRGERGLVRAGSDQGGVTAEFELPPGHPARDLLAGNDITSDELVVRRTVTADGRSRAFVNDTAVSTGLLRQLGDLLVEVHGQFDQRGLLDARNHRAALDAFGGLEPQLAKAREAWTEWRAAQARLDGLSTEIEAARREEDYLRHRERELADLDAEPGEEEELAQRRQHLVHREKLATALREALAALSGSGGAVERAGAAERRLERSAGLAPEMLEPAVQALGRVLTELAEAEAAVESALRDLLEGGDSLETIEERLFALRDASRKHRVPVDELPALLAETRTQLERIDAGATDVEAAAREVGQRRKAYLAAAEALAKGRAGAAGALAKAVMAELPPLKLERAHFRVALEPLGEEGAGPEGTERVAFEVSTNPGQPFGPLSRIASGGELSRFMLALKVVLARLGAAETLIFDEVDTGLGGATADAVGERLARLGEERQVLVVTHAPQVAARADHHFTVSKHVAGGRTHVRVTELEPRERRDEIARMLAGAEVTEAARAAADSLMRVGSR
jgi:DNA repair protein RecN (Recombination protein N)